LNVDSVRDDVTSGGRLFHGLAAAMGKKGLADDWTNDKVCFFRLLKRWSCYEVLRRVSCYALFYENVLYKLTFDIDIETDID